MSDSNDRDVDIEMLAQANDAISKISQRMRKTTLEFLWDKWIEHAAALDSKDGE